MRECGECTKCCEGSLFLTVKGRKIGRSHPCHFLSKLNKSGGCTIYEDKERTEICGKFQCEWLVNPEIPEWMKPSLVDTIIVNKNQSEIPHFEVIETNGKIDSVVLNWIIMYAFRNTLNLRYSVNGDINNFGSAEFIEYLNEKLKS
jgi:hypothetical protein